MDYKKLADLLYPNVKDVAYWEKKFPKRDLKDGQEVTRIAPSPTGFFHIGGVYQALIGYSLAQKSNGVFYIRIEDTDQKREIENADIIAVRTLEKFNLAPTEGYFGDKEIGIYGPYKQSQRLDIYHSFAKLIVANGNAFPCFCEKTESIEDIMKKRDEQLELGDTIEGKDPCRNLTYEEIEKKIKEGKPFALRLLSRGNEEKTFMFHDEIKGTRELHENGKDIVLIKSNGIPVYAFAHAVDDHFMGTTVITRGEEWFPSLSAHLEIFDGLGFKRLRYAHSPVVCKLGEEGNKRKLSKRKDPEADCRFFLSNGIPVEPVKEYLMNLLNSSYEIWKMANPNLSLKDYDFNIAKIGSNSPMFDLTKLYDYSKIYISKMSAKDVYDSVLTWAEEYDTEFANYLKHNKKYCTKVFNIDRETPKPRKDIYMWSMVKDYFKYMWNKPTTFELLEEEKEDYSEVKLAYAKIYKDYQSKEDWFNEIKVLAEKLNYATDNKLYKQNPDAFKGNTAKLCEYIRIAITGQKNSPDLFEIMNILGEKEVIERLK